MYRDCLPERPWNVVQHYKRQFIKIVRNTINWHIYTVHCPMYNVHQKKQKLKNVAPFSFALICRWVCCWFLAMILLLEDFVNGFAADFWLWFCCWRTLSMGLLLIFQWFCCWRTLSIQVCCWFRWRICWVCRGFVTRFNTDFFNEFAKFWSISLLII